MSDAPQITQEEARAKTKAFLDTCPKGIFGILDEQGLPTTSMMLYVADDDLNIYFGTRKVFSKYAHVKACPTVALTVVEGAPDPLRAVDLRGEAVEVNPQDIPDVRALMKSKNTSTYYVEDAEDFTMFKITPTFMRYLDASSGELIRADIDCRNFN